MKLITKNIERVFTFGCSFTKHKWPTWANIVALDVDAPLYNYGNGGAGNHHTFNVLMNADNEHKFTENDLVIVCWTNIAREDRYIDGKWVTPGNIFTQGFYDRNYIKKYVDIEGFIRRDLAFIKATWEFLDHRKCQFHMLKMVDFEMIDQMGNTNQLEGLEYTLKQYKFYLDQVLPSFYSVLWNNDLESKFLKETEIHKNYKDGHPLVAEHLKYLEHVFDHTFSESTCRQVSKTDNLVVERIKHYADKNIKMWETEATFEDLFFN